MGSTSSSYDWRTPQNDNLWQGVYGINNPCPPGFRLPTETEFEIERVSLSINDYSDAYNSPLKPVPAGFRASSDGTLNFAGGDGFYWSSTVNGSDSRYLRFYSGTAYMDSSLRANGFSVRCLED